MKYSLDTIQAVLNAAQTGYQDEVQRRTTIETKAGILFPVSVTFLIGFIASDDVNNCLLQCCYDWPNFNLATFITALACVVTFFLLLANFFNTVKVISLAKYYAPDPNQLFDQQVLSHESYAVSIFIISKYIESTDSLKFVNNKKVSRFEIALKFGLYAMCSYFIFRILYFCFL